MTSDRIETIIKSIERIRKFHFQTWVSIHCQQIYTIHFKCTWNTGSVLKTIQQKFYNRMFSSSCIWNVFVFLLYNFIRIHIPNDPQIKIFFTVKWFLFSRSNCQWSVYFLFLLCMFCVNFHQHGFSPWFLWYFGIFRIDHTNQLLFWIHSMQMSDYETLSKFLKFNCCLIWEICNWINGVKVAVLLKFIMESNQLISHFLQQQIVATKKCLYLFWNVECLKI